MLSNAVIALFDAIGYLNSTYPRAMKAFWTAFLVADLLLVGYIEAH